MEEKRDDILIKMLFNFKYKNSDFGGLDTV